MADLPPAPAATRTGGTCARRTRRSAGARSQPTDLPRLLSTDVPPFRLAQQLAEATDKEGPQYQRLTWDALRKSINGLVNKVRVGRALDVLEPRAVGVGAT